MRKESPSEFVQRARDTLELSREEFGNLLGVVRQTIMRWETGIVPVPEMARLAISQLLRNRKERISRA